MAKLKMVEEVYELGDPSGGGDIYVRSEGMHYQYDPKLRAWVPLLELEAFGLVNPNTEHRRHTDPYLQVSDTFVATWVRSSALQNWHLESVTQGTGWQQHRSGAWVSETAEVGPEALLGPYVVIGGSAIVEDGAEVTGLSTITERARVRKGARILDRSTVEGEAEVSGTVRQSARVSGNARVLGEAVLQGQAHVGQFATVQGGALVTGRAAGHSTIEGHAQVCGSVYGHARVFGKAVILPSTEVDHGTWSEKNCYRFQLKRINFKAEHPATKVKSVASLESLSKLNREIAADRVFVEGEGFYYEKEAEVKGLPPGSLLWIGGNERTLDTVEGWKPAKGVTGYAKRGRMLAETLSPAHTVVIHGERNHLQQIWIPSATGPLLLQAMGLDGEVTYQDPNFYEHVTRFQYRRPTPLPWQDLGEAPQLEHKTPAPTSDWESPTIAGTIGEAVLAALAERALGPLGQALTATGRDLMVASSVSKALAPAGSSC